MATEIKIPVPDQTTTEVRIVDWKIKPGDSVTRGQIIMEVESDKSVVEVESPADGMVLKLLVQVDDMVPVAQVVGFIGQPGEQVEAASAPATPATAAPAATTPAPVTAGSLPEGVTEIKIPVPDQTTTEVRIVDWKIKPGDTVTRGQIIMEVESDKSVVEVESPADGTVLKLLVQVDDMVPVAEVVGFIGKPGTVIDTLAPAASAPAPTTATIPAPAITGPTAPASPLAEKTAQALGVPLTGLTGTGAHGKIMRDDVLNRIVQTPAAGGRIIASPNARRLARELGVELNTLGAGSGPNGRLVGKDVQAFVAQRPAAPAQAATAPAVPAAGQPQSGTTIPISKMRRAIGNNLQMSFRDTPHFNVTMAIDMSQAMAFRKLYNTGKDKPQQISVNDLVVRATAIALKKYPAVNSRLEGDAIRYLDTINIGIATALESGLVVPVLADAAAKNWSKLAAETKRLASEARKGKIIGAGKGNFTLSNLGMFGVEQFTAIINPGESAIMAIGAVQDEVAVVNGMIGIKPILRVTLCSDHRLIDGALAAQFLQSLKLYLEKNILEG